MAYPNKLNWYPRYADSALAGMVQLTLEERGAYNTLLDLAYARHGDLPDDDKLICRHLNCRPQTWRRLRNSLETHGKLTRNLGQIVLKRVVNELKTARKLMVKRSVSKRKANKNKGSTAIITSPSVGYNTLPNPTLPYRVSKKETLNGHGWKGKTKPRHGQMTRDRRRVWIDAGTTEFTAYSLDYQNKYHALPPLLWDDSGAWFNQLGET